MSSKVLFTGKTHTTAGASGVGRSADGFLDIKLPEPHPAAENLFGVAWSACYMGALGVAASKRKVTLPDDMAVDAEELTQDAHGICPYSKATHGNIAVETTVVV